MAGLNDLLSWADNKRRVAGRNISDLVQNPSDYLSMTAGNIPQTVKEYGEDPMNFVGGGVGKIAWHGSPHKFDKFSLDKIGTGEGAQAYGHGLYLAEHPEVAKQYQAMDGRFDYAPTSQEAADAIRKAANFADRAPLAIREALDVHNGDVTGAAKSLRLYAKSATRPEYIDAYTKLADLAESGGIASKQAGHLYKTDIPDEAVARFLDWDKPLSQQAPEVQEMLNNAGYATSKYDAETFADHTGQQFHDFLRNAFKDKEAAQDMLRQTGIPGIRYLDGGSRSAGQGSSNFVAFDPEMIRILERNGQATGLEPWKPGEYRPMSDLMNVRTD